MKSFATLALTLALTAGTVAPAFAGDHGNFPMKADEFKQKVEARLAKKKAHIEKRIVDDKLDATKAKEVRDRYDERASKVRAAVATASQDGIVTKDEAKAVREAAGHRGHRGHHKK